MAAELRLLGLHGLVTALIDYATRWTAADGATRQRMVAPIPPRLGNKEPRPAQLPPAGPLPKTWEDLPQLIDGDTPAARCDALSQLLWQATTYPHELYSSSTQLRRERSVRVWRHDARARGTAVPPQL